VPALAVVARRQKDRGK